MQVGKVKDPHTAQEQPSVHGPAEQWHWYQHYQQEPGHGLSRLVHLRYAGVQMHPPSKHRQHTQSPLAATKHQATGDLVTISFYSLWKHIDMIAIQHYSLDFY